MDGEIQGAKHPPLCNISHLVVEGRKARLSRNRLVGVPSDDDHITQSNCTSLTLERRILQDQGAVPDRELAAEEAIDERPPEANDRIGKIPKMPEESPPPGPKPTALAGSGRRRRGDPSRSKLLPFSRLYRPRFAGGSIS